MNNLRKKRNAEYIIVALALLLPAVSIASTISLVPSATGGFAVEGSSFQNVAGLEMSITYDISTLSRPRVVQGSLTAGAMMAVNPNTPGTIRLAMVTANPVTGSGTIVTITFDQIGRSPGKITAINAKLVDGIDKPVSVATEIINPQGLTAEQQNQTGSASTVASSSAPQPLAGGVIITPNSAEQQAKTEPSEQEQQEHQTGPILTNDPASRKVDARADVVEEMPVRKVHMHKSVLERFREFKGTASIKQYLSFFEQDHLRGFRQEPLVALSGGNATVKVTFISVAGERKASEIALAGARMISLKRDPDYSNTWVAEIQPAKGVLSASLSIPQGNMIMVYPITVAPKKNIDLDRSGSVTERDFKLFLSDRGNPKAPRFDLNGDGKRDYLDDYIFMSNYIAGRRIKN